MITNVPPPTSGPWTTQRVPVPTTQEEARMASVLDWYWNSGPGQFDETGLDQFGRDESLDVADDYENSRRAGDDD